MSATHTDLGREVDRELAAAGSRGHRALVAGVVRDGETVVRGWAADEPVPDASALFEIGSVTKVFTGVLLADMHLRGEVSLDDQVGAALRLAVQPHAGMRTRFQIGLCWIRSTYRRDLRVVWHNGGTWGSTSFAGFAPERRAAAVVLSNTARGVDRTGLRLLEGAR